jgi:hypothetical protein
MNMRYDTNPQTILRSEPNDLIGVDTHGPMPVSAFGHRYILIMYDVLSKFMTLYVIKSLSTKVLDYRSDPLTLSDSFLG